MQNNSKKDHAKAGSIIEWIDYRLPFLSFLKHLQDYRVPKNLSYLWNLGSIAGIGLLIQIVTGIVLAMHYTPNVKDAFDSVENIMRNVNYGWLIRYLHAVGASMFFAAVYIHMFRGLYYGSYKYPRELLWHIGLIIFLTMMATAFMGYVLPWGQMSYWGATVITNLFSAIPFIGEKIVTWIWGGFAVGNPTLNRFFALHYLLPFILLGLVFLHVIALHRHGSNNPKGIDVKHKSETITFHPYYTLKDFVGFGIYFMIFAFFVFYKPNYLGHPDNYIQANPMITPAHIVPEWYFLPFYAILRAVPSKIGGVMLMFSSILVLFFLPWLDRSPVRSANYRPLYRVAFWAFLVDALMLGYMGGMPAEEPYIFWSQCATCYYFFHFLILTPLISKYEKPLPLPSSI
ncbi:MAG: cytochrome bc complex cytochrome b subunit [Rickettsiaceae bacterium]